VLRVFQITPLGRVTTEPGANKEKLPRRAVSAVAAWCLALAVEALRVTEEDAFEPIRHATQRRAAELERLGFYTRLRRRIRA
jgi:hypothetical protein